MTVNRDNPSAKLSSIPSARGHLRLRGETEPVPHPPAHKESNNPANISVDLRYVTRYGSE